MKHSFFQLLSVSALWAFIGISSYADVPARVALDTTYPSANWRFLPGAEFPGAKGTLDIQSGVSISVEGNAGTLNYDFNEGGVYVAGAIKVQLSDDFSELRIRVKADRALSIALRLRDASGQNHQLQRNYNQIGEWQTLRWDLRNHKPRSASYWDGAKDGQLHFPLTEFSLIVSKPKDGSLAGQLLFSDAIALQ